MAPVVKKDEIHSTNYVLLNGDLRDMNCISDKMLAAGLDKSLPTMFMTECVLVYMEPEKSREVIKWAGTNFSTALFLNYEPVRRILILWKAFGNGISIIIIMQILPSDRFGEIMQANLSVN